jgi:general secretion pathway protein J
MRMKHSRAFTLLEMIVAIGIFAVIAVVSYASLNRFLDHRDVLQAEMEKMKELQLVFSLLQQDMHFISGRIVRDEYGDTEQLLIINNNNVAGELLRFTTARRNVLLPESSTLQRTSYRWENGDFIRLNWRVLDRDQDSSESKHLLLTDVENVTANVLLSVDGVLQPLTSWDSVDQLPDGVEWTIQLADGKQYRRVFEVIGLKEKEAP